MIPLSRDFRIRPGVIAAGGTAIEMNGLFLSDNDLIPTGPALSFGSLDLVGDYFGTTSDEYKAAQYYFGSFVNSAQVPGKILISRFITAPAGVPAFVRSGSYKGITLAQVKAITGTLTLTIDGAAVTSQPINLSTATSFDQVAQLLNTALAGAVVSWLPVQQQFVIESATSGNSSTITFASGPAADDLKFTQDTGATLSQGAAQSVHADYMNNLTKSNQAFALFTTIFTADNDDHLAFANWVNFTNYRFGYIGHDLSVDAITQNNITNVAYQIRQVYSYSNVMMVYGGVSEAAAVLSYSASVAYGALNGRTTLKFREFLGLQPLVNDGGTYDILLANGYSFYGQYGANAYLTNYFADGMISGPFKWSDSFLNQIWLNANLLARFVDLFKGRQSYAFNDKGYGAISAVVSSVAEVGKTFGAIQTGVNLDAAQKIQINGSVGKDISSDLYVTGYYFYVPVQSAQNRAERNLKDAIFYYTDGGAIQSISMQSLMIQ